GRTEGLLPVDCEGCLALFASNCFRFASHSSRKDDPPPDFGLLVPVPGAAIRARLFSKAAFFFSSFALSPARRRLKISFSAIARGVPYFAAERRFRALASCGLSLPIGGTNDILKGDQGTLLIITDAT